MQQPLSVSEDRITKVGAVVLRTDTMQLLVIQPKPKPHTPEDLPPIGFVRGTRMYRDAAGIAQDANHDGRTAPPEGAVLEPLIDTLTREIDEEAGVTPAMLARAEIRTMGGRLFASRKKTPYPIYWFIVTLAAQDAVVPETVSPKDSLYVRWVTVPELQALVEEGRASPGYLEVAESTLVFLRS